MRCSRQFLHAHVCTWQALNSASKYAGPCIVNCTPREPILNVIAWIAIVAAALLGVLLGSSLSRRAALRREALWHKQTAEQLKFQQHAMNRLRTAHGVMRQKWVEQRSELARSQGRVRALEVRLKRTQRRAAQADAPTVDDCMERSFAPTEPAQSLG